MLSIAQQEGNTDQSLVHVKYRVALAFTCIMHLNIITGNTDFNSPEKGRTILRVINQAVKKWKTKVTFLLFFCRTSYFSHYILILHAVFNSSPAFVQEKKAATLPRPYDRRKIEERRQEVKKKQEERKEREKERERERMSKSEIHEDKSDKEKPSPRMSKSFIERMSVPKHPAAEKEPVKEPTPVKVGRGLLMNLLHSTAFCHNCITCSY